MWSVEAGFDKFFCVPQDPVVRTGGDAIDELQLLTRSGLIRDVVLSSEACSMLFLWLTYRTRTPYDRRVEACFQAIAWIPEFPLEVF